MRPDDSNVSDSPGRCLLETKVIATDGSGGKWKNGKEYACCGAGLAILSSVPDHAYRAGSTVPGRRTVPRAELWAFAAAALAICQKTHITGITIVVDVKYVHDNIKLNKRDKALKGNNRDLWELVFQAQSSAS